jgi:hypothetical protein
VFPVGIRLRDPRSQKRDSTARRGRLGHPSISPFDIAEGTSESAARDAKGEDDFTWKWVLNRNDHGPEAHPR